jgi:transcriptional activator SPT8
MEDAEDAAGEPEEAEDDGEGEGEGEDEEDDGDGDGDNDDDEQDDADTPSQQSRSNVPNGAAGPSRTSTNPTVTLTSPSPRAAAATGGGLPFRPSVRPEALTATVYDIVPTIAAPQGTSINTITATPDMRWVFSGGSDGYIRKYNWVDTVNGKLALTVAQRHPFVDSVTKAGVLMSYWENEDSG